MGSWAYTGKSAYRGEIASRYDADRRGEPVWEQEQEFVGAWAGALPPGGTVLDIPTGTGRFLELFLGQGLRVEAQDISEDMLAEIRRQHPAMDATKLRISQGDAEHLALADDSIDYLVSWRFLHLVPMPVVKVVLKEFRRVCRGVMVVQVFAVDISSGEISLGRRVKNLLRPFWRRLRPAKPAEPTTPWSHIPSNSHRETTLFAAFAEAGLVVDKIHTFDPAANFPTRVYFLSRAGGAGSRAQ